jgi:hypothetical protein
VAAAGGRGRHHGARPGRAPVGQRRRAGRRARPGGAGQRPGRAAAPALAGTCAGAAATRPPCRSPSPATPRWPRTCSPC